MSNVEEVTEPESSTTSAETDSDDTVTRATTEEDLTTKLNENENDRSIETVSSTDEPSILPAEPPTHDREDPITAPTQPEVPEVVPDSQLVSTEDTLSAFQIPDSAEPLQPILPELHDTPAKKERN